MFVETNTINKMEKFECKIKTGTGRNVTVILGYFESIQGAIVEATTGYKSKELVGAVSMTVQVCGERVSSRKKVDSKG